MLRLPSRPRSWAFARGSARDSVGASRGILYPRKFGAIHNWEAIGEAREIFDGLGGLRQTLLNFLRTNCDKIQESDDYLSVELFMVGRRVERTKPTVMIMSDDKVARVEAFDLAKESGILAGYPGFELGHSDLIAIVSAAREFGTLFAADANGSESECVQLFYQPQDANEPLRMATAGGLVRFKDELMLLTVNHLFKSTRAKSPSPDRASEVASRGDCEITGLDDFDDDDDFVSGTSLGSASEQPAAKESSGSEPLSEGGGESESESSVLLSNSPKSPIREEAEYPTSPGGYDPATTARVDLARGEVSLGKPLVSSPDLDFALIKNDTKASATLPPGAIWLENPSQAELQPLHYGQRNSTIQVALHRRGIVNGILVDTNFPIRLPNTREFIEVLAATFSRPLIRGDCGSWVRIRSEGQLIGHVFATIPDSGLVLVMPAYMVLRRALKLLREQEKSEIPLQRKRTLEARPVTVHHNRLRDNGSVSGFSMESGSSATTFDSGYGTDRSREFQADGSTHDYSVIVSERKTTKENKPVVIVQHHASAWDEAHPHPSYRPNESQERKTTETKYRR